MEVDNREIIENPKLKCKLGLLSRSDGSAILSEGESVVLAALYGPVEVKLQKVLIDKASVECFYKSKAGGGVQDRLRESIIKNICETALAASLYPRAAILINIQELQNRGQLISCAINAASLACLNSGIDMKFIFGAVSCFLLTTSDGDLTLNPPISEDQIKSMFVFVFNNTTGNILASHTKGSFSIEQYKCALDLCREESKKVFSFIKRTLLEIEKK